MTTSTLAPAVTRTVAEVQCEEFRDQGGTLVDRRIMVGLSCGHWHFVSIPLTAPLPQVGDASNWFCLSCHIGGRS